MTAGRLGRLIIRGQPSRIAVYGLRALVTAGVALALWTAPRPAAAFGIDFDPDPTGMVETNPTIVGQYTDRLTATVSGYDGSGNPIDAVALDTSNTPKTSDFKGSGSFANTNDSSYVIDPGSILILDGESAGRIEIAFNGPISLYTINFFDVDSNENAAGANPIRLFDVDGNEILGTPFYTPTTGNKKFDTVWFGGITVKRIIISAQGSFGIDAIKGSSISEPFHPGFMVLGIGFLIVVRRFLSS